MHLSSSAVESKFTPLAVVLLLVALWLLLHGYHGLTGDGQIYAFQAFARIHPQLAGDLYLQHTSQDQFTIFSPIYARFIGWLGLEPAARLLTAVFTLWFLAAAWSIARTVAGRGAWLAVASVMIVAGDYGGSGVFRLLEPYLTARLPAEALVLTAIACQMQGRGRIGLLLATAALFIHPLIALPGLLLLICLRLSIGASLSCALAGILAVLGIAAAASIRPSGVSALAVMDAAWLDIARERSQFLFLQLWSARDWSVNVRPFFYLAFTAVAVPDERLRKLGLATALVGATGLAVACIGSIVGPTAILLQGQAWRWEWLTVLGSALLLPVTALHVWRDAKCGPLCAIMLLCGWTLPAMEGTACVSLALLLWLARPNITERLAAGFSWVAAALGVGIFAWILLESRSIALPLTAAQSHDSFGLRVAAALLTALLWWCIRRSANAWTLIFSGLLAGLSIWLFPAALTQSRTLASASDVNEFSDWTQVIPPTSTVLVTPARDVGAFVWFTLQRPNYLAVDQSAGVVFSRTTALEVRRRSEVLLPLLDANWKIRTSLRAKADAGRAGYPSARTLTSENLAQVCADPQLGFVASPRDVGFDPLRHQTPGAWKDWSLYDCRKVRSRVPAT
jgi:hypothetical protein